MAGRGQLSPEDPFQQRWWTFAQGEDLRFVSKNMAGASSQGVRAWRVLLTTTNQPVGSSTKKASERHSTPHTQATSVTCGLPSEPANVLPFLHAPLARELSLNAVGGGGIAAELGAPQGLVIIWGVVRPWSSPPDAPYAVFQASPF